MPNLRYEIARLRTDFYHDRVSERYLTKRKLPPPSYVIWDSTRRCNLACQHCGATKETYSQELTTAQIRSVLDQLADLKVRMFAVTGGEPLLRQDLLQVLAYASGRGLKTGISTNGYLLDRSMAGHLLEAGVFSVQVSLDGLEGTHNSIRLNRQSFSRAIQALEFLKELHFPLVSVATTVSPHNISDLNAMRQFLLHLGIRLWRLAPVMPIGRARDAGLSLDGAHLVTLFRFIQENDHRDLHIYLGENLTFLGNWDRKIRRQPVFCPIGFTACCIGVDGYVRGCPEQSDVTENREGSILDSNFTRIWQNGFKRYRTREVLASDPVCASCRVKLECLGGCWVMRTERQQCVLDLTSLPEPAVNC